MGNIPRNSVVYHCLRLLNLENYRHPFADTGAKKLLTGSAIMLLVDAQLRQHQSLWDIEENLRANRDVQQLVNVTSIHGSTVYRKLETLPTDELQHLAMHIFKIIDLHYSERTAPTRIGRLHIIDSTQIRLPKWAGEWAYCSRDSNGIKVHVRLVMVDEQTTYPDQLVQSTAAVSDQDGAIELVVDKEATYVLDRGYINYLHYYEWHQASIRFVARVKANSKLPILQQRDVSEESNIRLDADVQVKKADGELFTLRLVEYEDEQKRVYRVVTNRWDISAMEVAEIYRRRWMIELFFKWMKQHLKLVKLYNHKPQAVWNQVWLTMIAYGLVELIKIQTGSRQTKWEILKRLRHYWFAPWSEFLESLYREPTRPSKGRVKKGKRGRPRKHPKKQKPVQIMVK